MKNIVSLFILQGLAHFFSRKKTADQSVRKNKKVFWGLIALEMMIPFVIELLIRRLSRHDSGKKLARI